MTKCGLYLPVSIISSVITIQHLRILEFSIVIFVSFVLISCVERQRTLPVLCRVLSKSTTNVGSVHLAQTFATTAGATYTNSFDYSARTVTTLSEATVRQRHSFHREDHQPVGYAP